ncbi:MAG: SDR family oxidoreductase [Flavobacteriales bacterium]|nr:SDR family oxidoreductase [Flavobacteriales bacterium]
MLNLKGKTILVTGASSGIGACVAKLCDDLGANVILTARSKAKLTEVKSKLSERSQVIVADLTDENEFQNLILNLTALDGFVHCAGKIQPFPIKFIKQKHIDEIFSVNLNSAILLSSNLLKSKKFKNGASVVFISSISAEFPYMGGALYSASKSALESFARSFALENASMKIRANIVSPALVKTEMFEQTKNAYDEADFEKFISHYPLGVGEPQDVANTIAFLLSDLSKWITGTTIRMDGGLLLNSKRD